MNERQYLMEWFVNRRPHHALCREPALEWALGWLRICILFGHLKDRCDPETAKKIVAMIDQHRYADAMDVWNAANINHRMALHEIEFVAPNCHHDSVTTVAVDDVGYLVKPCLGNGDYTIVILANTFAAMDYAVGFLRDLIGRRPPVRCDCDKATRQQVRKLLRNNEIAKAIDTWMATNPTATIAIHKIRAVRTNCHHDVA